MSMTEHTKDRIVRAAADLLDSAGEAGVTLRAVAERVGVSHNAPYRHLKDRNALLAAVAEQDFRNLGAAFRRGGEAAPIDMLTTAAHALIAYARAHPARYRLLFSDPDIAVAGGAMETAALETFAAFGALVRQCQDERTLPKTNTIMLTGLIYATLHGAIDLELGGRARARKGLGSIEATLGLLLASLRAAAPAP